MLAHGAEELDQLGVAGVEADPDAGQVRALGERVHGHHAVGAVLEHRARRAVPGELGVALVGEHRHAVGPAPGRLRPEVAQAPGRVRRRVGPEQEGRAGVVGVDGVEVEPAEPPRCGRDRARRGTRPAPRPWRRSDRTPRDTARCPGRAVRRRSRCGTEATNSLVPTQAATAEAATSSRPKRRASHAGRGLAQRGLPAEAG